MSQPNIRSRIYIKENGDLVVTDLWEEILEVVGQVSQFCPVDTKPTSTEETA